MQYNKSLDLLNMALVATVNGDEATALKHLQAAAASPDRARAVVTIEATNRKAHAADEAKKLQASKKPAPATLQAAKRLTAADEEVTEEVTEEVADEPAEETFDFDTSEVQEGSELDGEIAAVIASMKQK